MVEINFTNMQIPLPEEEDLLLPRLIEALEETNTHLENIVLSNTGLTHNSYTMRFYEILMKNPGIKYLNLDTNLLDMDCIQ